ncbi:MAG: PorV/PorQ family protein [Candidatus Saganbacteria bacterium]|nr:PorV/PorQ family protein [Candidatus Saganbacteria bacterium]
MKKITLIIILCLSLMSATAAASEPNGGQADAFLTYGAGARALGMGKAFVALADDASATYWNPAGITQLERDEFLSHEVTLYEGTNYTFLSLVHPTLGIDAFGVNAIMLTTGSLEEVNESGITTGTFSNDKMAGTFAYGRRIYPNLSVGMGVKYISVDVAGIPDSKASADLGMIYKPWKNLSLGLVIQNAGSTVLSGETSDTLKTDMRAGVAYKLLDGNLTFAVDVDDILNGTPGPHGGVEFKIFNGMLALRAGADSQEYTAGAGLSYSDFKLDYSLGVGELGNSHRVSISYLFGPTLKEVRTAKAKQLLKKSLASFDKGKYVTAKDQITEAVDCIPDDITLLSRQNKMNAVASVFGKNIDLAKASEDKAEDLTIKSAKNYLDGDLQFAMDRLTYALSLDDKNLHAQKMLKTIEEAMGMKASLEDSKTGSSIINEKLAKSLKHFYAGEYDLAIKECQRVLEIDPSLAVAHKRLGSIYYMQNKLSDAFTCWKKAVELDPNDTKLAKFVEYLSKLGYGKTKAEGVSQVR